MARSVIASNYSGRVPINREDVDFSVDRGQGVKPIKFSAELRLQSYNFPADSSVQIVASNRRFASELPISLSNPVTDVINIKDYSLEDLDTDNEVKFRVSVIDVSTATRNTIGYIEGISDIYSVSGSNTSSTEIKLFEIYPNKQGMEQIPWSLRFEDGKVYLDINSSIPEEIWVHMIHSDEFKAYAWPNLIDTVLTKAFRMANQIDYSETINADSPWQQIWFYWGEQVLGKEPPINEDTTSESGEREVERNWIDGVIGTYAKQKGGLVTNLISSFNSEAVYEE